MPKKSASTRKPGRPSRYTSALADVICQRIAEGESLRKVCLDTSMPGKSTVLRWLAANENGEFRDRYAYARDLQADTLFDEALEVADNTEGDRIKTADGKQVIDHDHIARVRLRVDTRKWAAGRLAPARYGDRLNMEHSGGLSITHEQALEKLK